MTSLPDIGEVAYTITQGPFAEVAALIDNDLHEFLKDDVYP
ncbi:MAG: hypothetical protein CEN89_643 [Candidatus Berkelbacteria bacterium Licking1014_7]|uniref:Uncharacterized protein n=1 Tax=Candidatus Berkelbacteria bacterium Licking1014_7 TaxID=2017147 RepID=A0A554LI15_9BACT|nr:MAG: hypothetical protein CEN89_643 [Candidatus Berkelbacteria bacterium Licking1014_7]